jgi:hypothetical protein
MGTSRVRLCVLGICGLLGFGCSEEGGVGQPVLSSGGSAGSAGNAGVQPGVDAGGNADASVNEDAGVAGSSADSGVPHSEGDAGNAIVVEYSDTLDARGDWQFDVDDPSFGDAGIPPADGDSGVTPPPRNGYANAEIVNGRLLLDAAQRGTIPGTCYHALASLPLPQLAPIGAGERVTWKLQLLDLDGSASAHGYIRLRREPIDVTLVAVGPNGEDLWAIAPSGELIVSASTAGVASVTYNGEPVLNLQSAAYQGPASVELRAEPCGADLGAGTTMSLDALEISKQALP